MKKFLVSFATIALLASIDNARANISRLPPGIVGDMSGSAALGPTLGRPTIDETDRRMTVRRRQGSPARPLIDFVRARH